MSKQCLDVQQMQHLQELGLDTSNASMCWIKDTEGNRHLSVHDEYCYEASSMNPIPAYTLQDVLDALPKYYHIANIGWTKLSIRIHTTKEWEIGYVYTDELSKYAYGGRILGKELIDAAYELFCWCVEWGFVETDKTSDIWKRKKLK